MDAGRCSCWQAMWWKLDFGLQCHSSPSYSPGDGWVMVFCEKNQAPSDLPISITPSSRNNAHCKAKAHHSASMSILSFEKMFPFFPMKYLSHHLLNINMFKGNLYFQGPCNSLPLRTGWIRASGGSLATEEQERQNRWRHCQSQNVRFKGCGPMGQC